MPHPKSPRTRHRRHFHQRYKHQHRRRHPFRRPPNRKPPPSDAVYVYFVHVPKAAGSAVKNVLRTNHPKATHTPKTSAAAEGWWFTATDAKHTRVHISARGHTPARDFPPKSEHALKIATVRDPVDRFISAFRFVREGGIGHPDQGAVGQARKWAPVLQPFDTFEAFFNDKNTLRKVMHPRTGHTHFLPQKQWLTTSQQQQLDVDYVLRQDHLHEDLVFLCEVLHSPTLPDSVPKYNVTRDRSDVSSRVRKQVAQMLENEHGDVSWYAELTTPASITRMREATRAKVKRLFAHVINNVYGSKTGNKSHRSTRRGTCRSRKSLTHS